MLFSNLYPLTYVLSLISLIAWFYYRDHEQRSHFFRRFFLGSIASFGVCWLFAQGSLAYKLPVLLRELVILAIIPVVLSLFRKVGWIYFAVMAAVLVMLRYFYLDTLRATFPQENQQQTEQIAAPGTNSFLSTPELDPDGELLIELAESHPISQIQNTLDQFGLNASPAFEMADKEATLLDNYYLINVPPAYEKQLDKVKNALNTTGLVEWLEENERINVSPMDASPMQPLPGLNKKYGLNDPGLENLWGFEAMKVAGLYAVLKDVKPRKKALIAILDTGVDAGHEDLQGNFLSTRKTYDADVAGHGTHCAGIAAAVSNNGKGIASFSQTNEYVQVTSIKVLSDGGFGTQQTIINGILEAADRGADVLSLSLGGLSNDPRQRAYKKAVDYAARKGAVIVVAAGNSNRNAREFVPANVEGVITVSAVDTLLHRASFSNYVQDLEMGVAAPGVKIYSTFPNGQYRVQNGTSMATPYVSGLVGLMKSLKPDLTAKEAFEILDKTGGDTKNTRETGKLIQPGEAVRELLK